MRALTLLELLVEWGDLPLTSFIVVWLPTTNQPHSEEFPRVWQKICCDRHDLHGRARDEIDYAIRMSRRLECEIHTDPAPHYGWGQASHACRACLRPLQEHFTDAQIEAIAAEAKRVTA